MLTDKERAREVAFHRNKADNLPDADGHRWVPVWDVPNGEYIRLKVGGPVYRKEGYDRSEKRYWFSHTEDLSRWFYRKGSQLVLVGFTY